VLIRLTTGSITSDSPSYKLILHSLRQTITQLKTLKNLVQKAHIADNSIQSSEFFSCLNSPRSVKSYLNYEY